MINWLRRKLHKWTICPEPELQAARALANRLIVEEGLRAKQFGDGAKKYHRSDELARKTGTQPSSPYGGHVVDSADYEKAS